MKQPGGGAALVASVLLGSVAGEFINFGDADVPQIPSNDQQIDVTLHWQWESNPAQFQFFQPVQIRFSPNSDHVMVAHKAGMLQLYPTIETTVDDFIQYNMGLEVYSYADHGISSFIFDPDFPAQPYGYVLYSAEPGFASPIPNPLTGRPAPGTAKLTWPDSCPVIENNLGGKYCEHWGKLARLEFDPNTFQVTGITYLITDQCGGSSTHGTGNIELLSDGRMVITTGDNALFDNIDFGDPDNDGCFEEDKGMPQGQWRSLREDFLHGKLVVINQDSYRFGQDLEYGDDYTYIARGLRNPYRSHVDADDVIYVGDVGFGDADGTERVFQFNGMGGPSPSGAMWNAGWPCAEGIAPTPYAGAFAKQRIALMAQNGWDDCDSTYAAIENAQGGNNPDADPGWLAPIYEYRNGLLDPEYPAACAIQAGSVTGVHRYQGVAMPPKYQDVLYVMDFTKGCLWYFDIVDGQPDTTTPHVLMSQFGIVELETNPQDGSLYAVEYDYLYQKSRILKIEANGLAPPVVEETEAPEPVVLPTPQSIETCTNTPYNQPELEWEVDEFGISHADIEVTAVQFSNEHGETVTRAYNGMVPGPVMRMEACKVYKVNLINSLEGWPDPFAGNVPVNGFKDPHITNLHLHGLHVAGMSPGDSQKIEVLPGEEFEYTYVIPCDHSGGTHWYHAHHHGSVTLQAGGGLAAMLIIEDNPRTEVGMPPQLANLPEALLFFHEEATETLSFVSLASGDPIYQTTSTTDHYTVNGCDNSSTFKQGGLKLNLYADEWTRVRILNQGLQDNIVVNLFAPSTGDGESSFEPNTEFGNCEIGLLAMDGVYINEVPRMLEDNVIFLSISSRADVIVKCPSELAGSEFSVTATRLAKEPEPVGRVVILPNKHGIQGKMPEWRPCRPYYLTDLRELPQEMFPHGRKSLKVRDTINGLLFDPAVYLYDDLETTELQDWYIEGSRVHPFHMHVNHMQIQDGVLNHDEAPNWFQSGDWIDTVSIPDRTHVRFATDRYGGDVLVHCHIYTHSDNGIMSQIFIQGGHGPVSTPAVLLHGTCPLPLQAPFGGAPAELPGPLQVAHFDEGGQDITYNNLYEDIGLDFNPIRLDTSVEIAPKAGTQADHIVTHIKSGEWLTYTIDLKITGPYSATAEVGGEAQPLVFTLKLDNMDCESAEGILSIYNDPAWAGTGGMDVLQDVEMPAFMISGLEGPGLHTLTLCFDEATDFSMGEIFFQSGTEGSFLGVPPQVPGLLEAEYFDLGEDGYQLPAGAPGGQGGLRPDTLPMQAKMGTDYVLSNIVPGQSMSYSVDFTEIGNYQIGLELSTEEPPAAGIAFEVKIDQPDCSIARGTAVAADDVNWPGSGGKANFEFFYPEDQFPVPAAALGTHVLTVCFNAVSPGLYMDRVSLSVGGPPLPTPYGVNPSQLPGLIEAEFFDNGGQGIAYNNLFFDQGLFAGVSTLRPETTVEVEPLAVGAGYQIGLIQGMEWLSYTVEMPPPGEYEAGLMMATQVVPNEGLAISMKLDNNDCADPAGTIALLDDPNWVGDGLDQFQQIVFPQLVAVTPAMAGVHQLYVCFNRIDAMQLDYVFIGDPNAPVVGGSAAFSGEPAELPGVLELENYDAGGNGVSWNNFANPGFAESTLRVGEAPNMPETFLGPAGDGYIGFAIAGEWLTYSVVFQQAGDYYANMRVNAPAGAQEGIAFKLKLDNNQCATDVDDLLDVQDIDWEGTAPGVYDAYYNYYAPEPFTVPAAMVGEEHKLVLCLNQVPQIQLESIEFVMEDKSPNPPGPYLGAPVNGQPVDIPGVIEAAFFDEGGEQVAYHNLNFPIVGKPANVIRPYETPEIGATADGYQVGYNFDTEWLRYTVDIAGAGDYNFEFAFSSPDPTGGLALSVRLDSPVCGAAGGELGALDLDGWDGTGIFGVFNNNVVLEDVTIPVAGVHQLYICLERMPPQGIQFDGFAITAA
ncbi:unnamed protein product [Chrysoparadoxa australica]